MGRFCRLANTLLPAALGNTSSRRCRNIFGRLYRCAFRVENVGKALSELAKSIEPQGDPVWCPLPGTKIDGLYIAFLRSPDGVVFEFVERPKKYFDS